MEDFNNSIFHKLLDNYDIDDILRLMEKEKLDDDDRLKLKGILDLIKNEINSYAKQNMIYYIEYQYIETDKFDDEFNEEKRSFYTKVIKNVIIYNLMYENYGKNKFLNYIINFDFKNVMSLFDNDNPYIDSIIKSYLQFLIKRQINEITDVQIENVLLNNNWLNNLMDNKGFTTINDKLRKILIDMYITLEGIGCSFDMICYVVDEYFNDTYPNDYTVSEFPSILDSSNLLKLKLYQFKLLISDAYLFCKSYLKLDKNEAHFPSDLDELEIEYILDKLEEILSNQDSSILTVDDIHLIYLCFLEYNEPNKYYSFKKEAMKNKNNMVKIKKLNPLYMFD